MLFCIYEDCSHTNALNFVMPIKYQYIYLALADFRGKNLCNIEVHFNC
jgi:hypothetical protein